MLPLLFFHLAQVKAQLLVPVRKTSLPDYEQLQQLALWGQQVPSTPPAGDEGTPTHATTSSYLKVPSGVVLQTKKYTLVL